MTLDDDFIQIRLSDKGPPMRATCKKLGIEWPPPEILNLLVAPGEERQFQRLRFSQLSDQEASHPNLCRGAEYKPL